MSKKRGMGRKSQITIFMIVALIVLLLGSVYFYARQQGVFVGESVQPELVPVKSYVESCMKIIADDGLERIGLSGGYINVPGRISSNPNSYLSAFSSSGFSMPYWWYKGIDSVPSEEFIKNQLSSYVKSQIGECIGNFGAFNQTFRITELSQPDVEVQLNEEDTTISIDYDLDVQGKGGDFSANIKSFQYKSPARLKKMYDLASTIMERENKDAFLERKTIDLYSLDSEIPTTDFEVSCSAKIWELSSIKSKLQELLRFNIPYIRVQGTDFDDELAVPNPDGTKKYSDTYYNYHYVWEVDTDHAKYSDLKVAFIYDNWPIELHSRPSKNGLLESNAEKGSEMLKFLCLHMWHFTYDIDYPVVVSIFDGSDPKYQFNFAFRVSIDHNQPSRANKGTSLFEVPDEAGSEQYCSDVQNEITVFTVNNATGEDVKGMNLTFACGRFYCDMGQSGWLSLGAATGFTKRLPYCVLGVVKGTKEGFDDAQMFVQTDVDQRSYVLLANPVKEFTKYKVVRHLIPNPSAETELGEGEKASISITGNTTGYETFAFYPLEGNFPLKLPEGKDEKYNVNILVVDDENVAGGYFGEWEISKEALENADEIVFHVAAIPASTETERLEFVSKLAEYSKSVPKPELIRSQ